VSQGIGYQGWYRGGKRVAAGVVSQNLVEKTLFLINALKHLLNLRLRLRSQVVVRIKPFEVLFFI
jgi:hypothetical protein